VIQPAWGDTKPTRDTDARQKVAGEPPRRAAPLEHAPPGCVLSYYSGEIDKKRGQELMVTASLLGQLAGQAGLLAKMDPTTHLWIDLITSASVALRYPYTVTLNSISSIALEGQGHRFDNLQAGVVIETGGKHGAIASRIQYLLSQHTNTDETTLTSATESGDIRYTIRDRRLPPWAEISWGPVGTNYVLAIGKGAFDPIAAAVRDRNRSLAASDWCKDALRSAANGVAAKALYIDFAEVKGVADALFATKVDRVQSALGLDGVTRSLFRWRYEDRSVEIDGVFDRNHRLVYRTFASRRFLGDIGDDAIPEGASRYAVLDCKPAALLDAVSAAYLSARSPENREEVAAYWRSINDRAGVDPQEDIFALMDSRVVVHNHPLHALGIPFAVTIAVPLKSDPDLLRRRLDNWFEELRRELDEVSTVGLARDPSGIWYLHAGLQGPAMTVADDWLLISFSPSAVRDNAALLSNSANAANPR
jgi:hypothetical protein